MRAKPCYNCATGTLCEADLYGRTFEYRDEARLVFDEHLVVPGCDTCGELYLQGKNSVAFGSVLERLRSTRKREAVERFVDVTTRTYPNVPRAAWEKMLGVSPGYLSRLANGKRTPDTALGILMEVFVHDPAATVALLEATGHIPESVAAGTARRRDPTP